MQPLLMAGAGSRTHARSPHANVSTFTPHATAPIRVLHPVTSLALATAIAAEIDDQRVAIGVTGQPTGRFR